MRGFVLPLLSEEPNIDVASIIGRMRATGANSVGLMFALYQENASSTSIEPHAAKTPSREGLRSAIRAADGMTVFLQPIVLLANARGDEWRGSLEPDDPDAWWQSYRGHLLDYAELAQAEGVDWLVIGSELSSLDHGTTNTLRWAETAALVRERYSGRIAYAANWDVAERTTIWPHVDAIGLSAYFELCTTPDSPQSALDAAWRTHRDQLFAWRASAHPGKPLMLLEVGYPSLRAAACQPWNYVSDEWVDLEEQRRGFLAFSRAFLHRPELDGALIYTFTDFTSDARRSYAIEGKPAAEVVADWMRHDATASRD